MLLLLLMLPLLLLFDIAYCMWPRKITYCQQKPYNETQVFLEGPGFERSFFLFIINMFIIIIQPGTLTLVLVLVLVFRRVEVEIAYNRIPNGRVGRCCIAHLLDGLVLFSAVVVRWCVCVEGVRALQKC